METGIQGNASTYSSDHPKSVSTAFNVLSPNPETARGIVERCVKYCPELADGDSAADGNPDISQVKILRHNVGLRPSRKGGARVEKEIVKLPVLGSSWRNLEPVPNALQDGQSRKDIDQAKLGQDSSTSLGFQVVHAYGVGTAGYQESWGVAADVVALVTEFVEAK